MVTQSKILEVLPKHYGYVILTATASHFVNMWMAFNVGRARKVHKIEYPTMYSPDNKLFNCIQRAHQHTLENQPAFLFFLLVGGLKFPILSAAAGAFYLVGRIVFALGYYSGEPEKRRPGQVGMLGGLVLIGNTVCFAVTQLLRESCQHCVRGVGPAVTASASKIVRK